MRTKVIFFGLLIALAGLGTERTFAQQDEDVRGAFLTTRPKAAAKPADKGRTAGANTKPNRRRPKAVVSNPPASGNTTAKGGPKTTGPTTPKAIAQRLGLGLTLFMRDSNGLSVRVDPTREFHKGDHVRVLLETNADGYLYIFNTTSGGAPLMIYPDPELDEAGNYIQSHVPVEIPSSTAAEERLRWFTFDAIAGIEKLHFVFTREPLASIPIEDDLITFCRANSAQCPWTPGAEVWANIQKEMNESVQIAKPTGIGKAQTDSEAKAATRGIGLNRDDAEPSLIMLTASTSRNMLVATIDLVHKAASLVGDDESYSGVAEAEAEDPPQ